MADTMLSFSDNSLSTNFLSMDDLRKACPAAFKTSPTNPNVSERYVQASTATVIEDLAILDGTQLKLNSVGQRKVLKVLGLFI